ncbi:MAG: hypothetical protein K2X41_03300 [Hyphomicrobium sp.]|nr:hypothetical protein [Hyphomicrobium sp.]
MKEDKNEHVILERARYSSARMFGDPAQSAYRKKSIVPPAHPPLDPQTALRSADRTRFEDDVRE